MLKARWYIHPIIVFVFSLLALGTSLFFYIHWYLEVSSSFSEYVKARNLDMAQFQKYETWVIILVLSILVAIILAGMALIFIYYQKLRVLYQKQQNFIGGFTHELKTPIASIRLFLDTFSRHELTRKEQLEYLGYMIRDTERLSGNVARILELAKIEKKNYKAQLEDYDLVALIEDFFSKEKYLLNNCTVTIKKDNIDGALIYPVARFLVEMLLNNMIINACNYNQSQRPEMVISFEKTKRQVLIKFTDNGIGLNKRELNKVFKKFYQVGQTAKGSGLGLYLSQLIAHIHRGKLSAFSEGLGEGTTFILSLPRRLFKERKYDC